MTESINPPRSTLRAFTALVAKDWRLFRVPAIGLVVVTTGPYLLSLAEFLHDRAEYAQNSVAHTAEAVEGAILLTAVLAAVFGGMAIAGERANRTADFLAMLPITRLQIVLSKWTATSLIIGSCFIVHLTIWSRVESDRPGISWLLELISLVALGALAVCCFVTVRLLRAFARNPSITSRVKIGVAVVVMACVITILLRCLVFLLSGIWELLFDWSSMESPGSGSWLVALLIALTLCFFGIAWLFSAFTRSPSISACLSIGVTFVAMAFLANWVQEPAHRDDNPLICGIVASLIGLPCLITGTIYYLRRIAP